MKRLLILCVLAVGFAVVGCNSNNPGDDGIDAKGKATATRVDQIAKASGGDWSKVSQEDKDFLLKEVGSEQSAKMVLQSKAGNLSAAPGGKTQ